MSQTEYDHIAINNLLCQARIGVTPEEIELPRQLLVDLELYLDLQTAANSDQLADTINYLDVAKNLTNFFSHNRFALLESAAQAIANHLLDDPRLNAVRVAIRKPHALLAGATPAVVLLRKKQK